MYISVYFQVNHDSHAMVVALGKNKQTLKGTSTKTLNHRHDLKRGQIKMSVQLSLLLLLF